MCQMHKTWGCSPTPTQSDPWEMGVEQKLCKVAIPGVSVLVFSLGHYPPPPPGHQQELFPQSPRAASHPLRLPPAPELTGFI